MFGRLPGLYTAYKLSGLLSRNGILPGAKFTLRPSIALSYICSVTTRHSSSERQPNFAALIGRPSRWASAHISSFILTWNHGFTVNDGGVLLLSLD